MNRFTRILLCTALLAIPIAGCERSTEQPSTTPQTAGVDDMWAHMFLGTVDIEYADGRTGRTGFTQIDEQTIAMSGSWLFGATETEVSLLCCDPSTITGVVAYDAARDIALVRIDPPLSNPGTIPAKQMPDEDDYPYRIVFTLPIKFETGPGFTSMPTTVEQRADWAGIGQTLIFTSDKDLVMSGSLIVNNEGYPIALLNGWGGGARDIGTPMTDVITMRRHDPIPLSSFSPEHMTGQHQSDALVHQAQDLRNGRRLQQALQDASQSLEIDPTNWRALYELGVLADIMMGNNLQQAQDLLEQSIAIEDEWSESLYSLGLVQYKLGQYKDAIKSLTDAVNLDDGNPDAHQMMGLSLWQSKGPEFGIAWLQNACDRAPDTFMYLENLWSCLSELDREAESLERFQSFVQRNPDDAEGRSALGQLMLQLRNPEIALVQYEWLTKHSPDDPDVLTRLAFCQLQTGDREGASESLDRAEAIAPNHELLPALKRLLEE